MTMTVAALHKQLGALIEAGHGRKPVAVNKRTFTDPCEQDGAVILAVHGVEGPRWIPTVDEDGGSKWNKNGTEAGKHIVVLFGCEREAPPNAEAQRAKVAELEAKLAKPVAWQKAILRAEEWGVVIIGWEFCAESEYRSLLIPKRALVDAAIAAKEPT